MLDIIWCAIGKRIKLVIWYHHLIIILTRRKKYFKLIQDNSSYCESEINIENYFQFFFSLQYFNFCVLSCLINNIFQKKKNKKHKKKQKIADVIMVCVFDVENSYNTIISVSELVLIFVCEIVILIVHYYFTFSFYYYMYFHFYNIITFKTTNLVWDYLNLVLYYADANRSNFIFWYKQKNVITAAHITTIIAAIAIPAVAPGVRLLPVT